MLGFELTAEPLEVVEGKSALYIPHVYGRRIPDAVRKDFTGFMMVILKQQNGEIAWPYTEFESLGDAALAHGFRHVEFHGWGVGGHDTLYPEYDPDPEMGGRDALVRGVKCDVSLRADVKAMMDVVEKEAGRLDVVVSNAANFGLGQGTCLETTDEQFLSVLQVNVLGGFRLVQLAARNINSL